MTNRHALRRLAPLSLRLSPDERARLEQDAQGIALGAYIKAKIFGEPERRVHRHQSVRNQRTIAQLLARLGASGLAVHMQELANAASSGSLACDDETAALLRTACADIKSIRSILLTALGLKGPQSPPPPPSTPRQAFDSVSTRDEAR